jgi:quercetin dioxygenase-like cupin family protein
MNEWTQKLLAMPIDQRIPLQGEHQVGCVSFSRVFSLKAGEEHPGHFHETPHDTVLCFGAIRVERWTRDGERLPDEEHVGPKTIPMPAEIRHRMIALTDACWFCLWPHYDDDGNLTTHGFKNTDAAMRWYAGKDA